MSAVQPDPQMSDSSARRVYFVLAASVVVLTCALLGLLQLQQFDTPFRNRMSLAADVQTSPREIIRGDSRRFALLRVLLIASVLVLVSYSAVTLRQHLRHRRRVEAALRASEEKLRTISEAALDAVIMMDAAGRAVHWNPAAHRMFGYSAEEILGQDIHQLLTPVRYRAEAAAAIRNFLVRGQGRAVGQTLELQALRKNGEEFPIEISLAPIRVDSQWNAVAVVRDITARRQVEQALSDKQRSLRRLLRSHDQERKLIAYEIHDGLAQQLAAALYQCQAAERSAQGASDSAVAAFRDLEQALRRCLAETRRLVSGVRPPVLDECGVVTAVQGLIDDVQARGGPHIDLRHSIQSQRLEPVVENTIFRIIQEGLANACRHSHGQHVWVELTETAKHIELLVRDDGQGFDPEKTDPERYGLAGIRERTRLLGGRLTLQTATGNGTLLAVQLPKDVGDLAFN